ncbi:MAG TPA: magnesium transporter MgtC [Porphyromonadaceae bacterium]|jgi:putative Mg2+ transporter-C (MgtC) family protein|nr:MgtC/SapB family protein [Fermentimonas sp.]MDD3510272.1 MgtC/SapB family protein [Fermentimonas sp.]NLC85774.1 MgtC/SapB family protein [Bacteroidales bacterium]HBT85599.1 magnesium transporter MgtC [Porphyromonadaceae bacterium]
MFPSEFLLGLLAASVAGGAVGIERETSNKSAGLRTNMLVAVGSSVFVMISTNLLEGSETGDPSRVMGQIVTGIGFLGAGVILHRGTNVKGLTTAATIWCSAALGCLAGFGLYWELAATTVLIIIINTLLRRTDSLFNIKKKNNDKTGENSKNFE